MAALGYEPVGFTTRAEAAEACKAMRGRFDAALYATNREARLALDFAATLHRIDPAADHSGDACRAGSRRAELAASGIFEVVHHPLTSAELSSTLSRCVGAAAVSHAQSDRTTRHDAVVDASRVAGGARLHRAQT